MARKSRKKRLPEQTGGFENAAVEKDLSEIGTKDGAEHNSKKANGAEYNPEKADGTEYIPGKPGKSGIPTAAYIRLSMENSGNKTDETLQTQITMVETYIHEHDGFFLQGTYVDNGFTGTNFDRPEFLRMMENVKRGEIRCIVVKDLSRFGRDYLETGYYLETIFPLLGVRFIAITDQFDSSREEDRNSLAIPIKNMVNAMYAKDFSRKQEAFHEMCRKTGKYMRKTEPYGYSYSEEEGRLVIDPETEPYVRLVFAWTLAGISRGEIARRMEILEAPTATGSGRNGKRVEWTSSTVKGILFNPVYAGFHVMGKSRVSKYRGVEPEKISRDEWLLFPDFHEAYVTMDDYERIEEMITNNHQNRDRQLEKNGESRERLKDVFRGMVFCAECGRQMNLNRGSHHRDYRNRSFVYYRCRYDSHYEENVANFVQQNYLKIIVTDQLRILIRTVCDKDKVLRPLETEYAKKGILLPMETNISRLTNNIRDLEERLMKVYLDYSDGILDEEAYVKLKSMYMQKKEEAYSRRRELYHRLELARQSVQRYHEMAARLEKYMDLSEFNEELTREMISRIIVGKDSRVELVFKCRDVFCDPLLDEFMNAPKEGGE